MRHDEALFVNAGQFLPERWLRGKENNYRTDPFTFLPFGFGARSCIGTAQSLSVSESYRHVVFITVITT